MKGLGEKKKHTEFWLEKPKGRDSLEDLGEEGRIRIK